MLRYLRVRNLAVFEEASCELGPGLNLITGETGAGKSLLVDAIGLLVGERASLDAVRSGETCASVEGVFDLNPEVRAILEELGIDAEGEELVVRRRLQPDRSRAFLNDSPTTVASLARVGELLVEIHGQHSHQALLRPEVHRDWLDAAGGLEALRNDTASTFGILREARQLWRSRREGAEERQRRIQRLRDDIEDIERVGPRGGEAELLRQEASLLRHRERLKELAHGALHDLSEDEGACAVRAGRAADALEEIGELVERASLAEAARQVREAGVQLEEAARGLASFVDELDADPERLERMEARLVLLERLERRYGGDLGSVLEYLEEARGELESLEGAEGDAGELEARLEDARSRYAEAAAKLREGRRAVASGLSRDIEVELEALEMAGSRFEIRVDPHSEKGSGVIVQGEEVRPSPHGSDRVEFLLSPNAGEEPRPLRKIASGGELSRVMLALRAGAPAGGGAEVVVFDEVDAGISGTTAAAVGERLARVAQTRQVLCVTHLAPVAARAARHLSVDKTRRRARTHVEVRAVEGDERIEEVARMLGGTQAAAEHARKLLARSHGGLEADGASGDPDPVGAEAAP